MHDVQRGVGGVRERPGAFGHSATLVRQVHRQQNASIIAHDCSRGSFGGATLTPAVKHA